ncbi:hypothetical protein MJG53_016855 [Ovis ammon polii x Ovis aries]|uniref:Uncharacterized protein n=1 Tax=Ovis ammon polii x Ovis aries TaxID=2918886 RepID=A0ACB9U9V1_9CETA|nr:hypothetical protein MJG53_016855 [Ovis ammon polii x Ovis aries]
MDMGKQSFTRMQTRTRHSGAPACRRFGIEDWFDGKDANSQVHILDNATVSGNDTGILSPDVLLRISIPLDSNFKPEKCRCFLHPQWQLLHLNGTFPNMTDLDTEPCVDGWVFDHSLFSFTIVTENSSTGLPWPVRTLSWYRVVSCRERLLSGIWEVSEVSPEFANTVPYFGIFMNLQLFGSNIFLFQVIFGALTISARCLSLLVLNHTGRRLTQMLFMFLVGLSILANMFMPREMQTLRLTLASVGMGCVAAAVSSNSVHNSEFMPTLLRAKASGLNMMASRCGAALAPLLMTLVVYLSTLSWIIYGVRLILAGLLVLILPETRNIPLLDTVQDVENKTLITTQHSDIRYMSK